LILASVNVVYYWNSHSWPYLYLFFYRLDICISKGSKAQRILLFMIIFSAVTMAMYYPHIVEFGLGISYPNLLFL